MCIRDNYQRGREGACDSAKRLISYIDKYGLGKIFTSVEMVITKMPGVMALMIDKGMSGESIGYILKIGAVLLVMSMMALVFGILAGTNAARASAGMARNLRKDCLLYTSFPGIRMNSYVS